MLFLVKESSADLTNCERLKKAAKKRFLPGLAGLFFCLI